MTFELSKLDYGYEALEPFIDAKTMEVHHSKHHQAYTDNFNAVIAKYPALANKSAEDILKDLNNLQVDGKDRSAIKNHGGGYLNHKIFWEAMGPQKEINQDLKTEIIQTFGSPEEFAKIFSEAATKQFGSGWAWLVRN